MVDVVWEDGYFFKFFRIDIINFDFDFFKIFVEKWGVKILVSNLVVVWMLFGIEEIIFGGVV